MKYAAPQKRSSTLAAPTPERYGFTSHAGHDGLEEEAERAADLALALPENAPSLKTTRQLLPAAFVDTHDRTFPSSVSQTLAEPGQPLERFLRADMERRFGYDFSQVRVHAGGTAANSALDVNAQAYTAGHHIVFASGQFVPHSQQGRKLIAHELAHVMQQSPDGRASDPHTLQRKPRRDVMQVDPGLGEPPTAVGTDADVADLLSPAEADRSSAPDESAMPAAPEARPIPAESFPEPLALETSESGALTAARRGVPARATGEGIPARPTTLLAASNSSQRDDTTMPRLEALLSPRRVSAVDRQLAARLTSTATDAAYPAEPSHASEADIGELLGVLAFGAEQSRETINTHAIAARAAVDRGAKRSTKKLEDDTKTADAAVRALAKQRRSELDITIRAHKTELYWLEKRCRDDANRYADNAKAAQKEGFGHYRGRLVNAFDDWIRSLDALKKTQSDHLRETTEENIRRMWRKYSRYDTIFIKGIGNQSEQRRQVQRDAAMAVVNGYAEGFEKTKTEILPPLAEACEKGKRELNQAREHALTEYDKGLPLVLKGIDDQLAAALFDIQIKAGEARDLLAKAAIKMHDRVDALEEITLGRNARLGIKVDGQIESGRASAERQFRRAIPAAMQPIAAMVGEAVGMLTNTDEELDPAASRQFVDEVVDFSLGAADATGDVFATARDASIGTLAQAGPFARRGFAAGRQDLHTTLHDEGAENEFWFIDFGLQTETYLRSTLTDLDQTFNLAVTEADAKLASMVNETTSALREPMENAQAEIRKGVDLAVSKQSDVYWRLGRDMHNAARTAAWRYDSPYLKRVVDVIEIVGEVLAVALGFAMIVGILLGVAFIAVTLFGELIVAAVGGFLIGYFGAQAYEERRKKQSWGSALLGAFADVTGLTDVRRAFTDSKMSPFDRGLAWGGFWLGLFGGAHGASRFFKAVKVRLPKAFTNPFRFKKPPVSATPEAPIAPGAAEAPVPPKASQMGFELPHQKLTEPDVPSPTTPKPEKIGFELPHQKLPEPEVPPPTAPPKPKRAGFELPHETRPSPDVPPAGAAEPGVSPRLHHRKPVVEEAPVSGGKRKIGFVQSDQPVPVTEAPVRGGDRPAMSGERPPTGGVITEMPRAQRVRGSEPPRGTTEAPGQGTPKVVGSMEPTPPRPATGETAPAGSPTKGSVVSTVEPEAPTVSAERRLSPDAEARLADEQAIQVARERRIADEARVKKLEDDLEVWKAFDKPLGRRRKPDEVSQLLAETQRELKIARTDLRKSQRAELEAEAAERVHLRRQRDVDPDAALHDPEVRKAADTEFKERQKLVAKNEAFIKANEADLIDAEAKVALRHKEVEATRPGSTQGKQSRELKLAREEAQRRLNAALRHLESVKARTVPAYRANQKHAQRMQDLDRVLNPGKYPDTTTLKGSFAEDRAHAFMDTEGYAFRGSSKKPGGTATPREQGLDGAYEKTSTTAEGPKHIVGESKYHQARLRKGQEKWEWVDERLDDAVGREHANRMRSEGYEYWVMKYNPKTQRVQATKLWEFRPNGKFGPGKRPLGTVHFVPPV